VSGDSRPLDTAPRQATEDAAQQLPRKARLAQKREQLLAPASALRELGKMLLKDARDRGQEEFQTDMQQIHALAERLVETIGGLLDPNEGEAEEGFEKRLRHDLRTPPTEIIGLCEIWLEDAREQLLEGFIADLEVVRSLGKKLVGCIDDLLAFKKVASDPDVNIPWPEEAAARQLIASLPHVEEDAPADITGVVLVVEDNDVSRDVLVRRLVRQGHTVAEARNGRQALDRLRAQSFDLVLLDILMPEMNGFQVLEALKADERLRDVPVIMITAFTELDGVARAIELGAEDYLPKPFNAVVLRARVGASLEKKRLRDRERLHLAQIEVERRRSDELLHVILPGEIVSELKETNQVRPRRHENVAVLFCDVVGFTPYCDANPPEQVVRHLQHLIEQWEESALRHEVEKIKTIGDAFMAAAGLLKRPDNPVLSCVRCGLEMIQACQRLEAGWNLRVGIHVGPVVAGVIGKRQYLFDLWGDTVNTAARMESHGIPGAITLSGEAWAQVSEHCCGEPRGPVAVKGKGQIEMYRFAGFV
jgi:class 3 adenylate cyclase